MQIELLSFAVLAAIIALVLLWPTTKALVWLIGGLERRGGRRRVETMKEKQ